MPTAASGAEHAAEQLSRLTALTAEATIAPDIQEALAGPGVSRYRKSVGFRVVESFDELAGPAEGSITVPRRLGSHTEEIVDVADRTALRHLYRRLLHDGRTDEQAHLINPQLLHELWDSDLAEPYVMNVWEARFPQLHRQHG